MSKEDLRREFEKLRKKIMRDNGWDGFICARCGHYSKSVHLHHIKELVYGGTNDPENLIPLCSDCHNEWDYYDGVLPFEQFLVTIPGKAVVMVHTFFKIKNVDVFSPSGLLSASSQAYRAVELTRVGVKLDDSGWTSRGLIVDQNRIFSKYPYSDEIWRKDMLSCVYGDILNYDKVRDGNGCV